MEKCATEEHCGKDVDREDQVAARGWESRDVASRLLKAVRGDSRTDEYPKFSI